MCRSLEEFREAYLRLTQEPPPEPDVVGPVLKTEPNEDDDDDDDETDHQPKRFRLVVKREEY